MIDCSAATSDEELQEAFTGTIFPFPNCNTLTISQYECDDCYLNTLTLETFAEVSFVNVNIHGTYLSVVEEGTFQNSEDFLQNLDLSDNYLESFDFEALNTYTELVSLNLASNNFSESTEIPVIKSETLQYLILSNNPKIVYSNLMLVESKELVYIDMSNVELTQIQQIIQDTVSMFDGLLSLETLDFSNNVLTQLDQNAISTGDNTLALVDLSNNTITDVQPSFINSKFISPVSYASVS